MTEPLSMTLNVATQTMARRLFPLGYTLSDHQPYDSVAHMRRQVRETGRFKVWSAFSADTVYGSAEINYDARAWHDWAHWRYDLAFDLEGEIMACYVQLRHLAHHYGSDVEAAQVLMSEVIGQALWYREFKLFPVEQRAFAERVMGAFDHPARFLMHFFEEDLDASDAIAMRIGRRHFRHGVYDAIKEGILSHQLAA